MLRAARFFTTDYLLLTTYCLLLTIYYLLFTTYYLLLATSYVLLTYKARFVLLEFVAEAASSRTTLTTDYLPLTTYSHSTHY